jgi:hypothetical protein
MRRLIYLLAAKHDLDNMFDYLAEASGDAGVALRFTGRLRAPRVASRAAQLCPPRLCDPVPYGVDTLAIVDIIEGQRDIEALLLD